MLIRLEHSGRLIEQIRSEDLTEEITIGRSKKCTWTVPPEDSVISGRHAGLTRKGQGVVFTDLGSKNGSYFQGKRIATRKLHPGDRISIGDSMLVVEKEEEQAAAAAGGKPEVVVRTGRGRGQKKTIEPPGLKIGSDPESGLVLLDTLVSRHHAEISIKEDNSCWIKDLGSKNGTSVNGLPLRADKERMLKDSDTISIAHLEIEFHDGTKARSSGQAWLRMGIMAATLVAALLVYWTFQRLRPPARHFIAQARKLAAAENFDEAEKALVKATGARNLASHRLEVEDMKRLLGVWESTTALWRRARAGLKDADWVVASRDLGMLEARKKEAWEWSPDALVQKDKVLQAKSMLDSLLSAKAAFRREDVDMAELKRSLGQLEAALTEGADEDYLAKMREELTLVKGDVEKLIREGTGLEGALDKLAQNPPPFEEIIKTIGEVKNSSGGVLQRKASFVHDAVVALGSSFALKTQCEKLAREMEFKKALSVDPELPTVDVCAVDARVSTARTTLEKSFEDLKTSIAQISYLHDQVLKLVDNPDAPVPEPVRVWQDAAVMEKVFACDSIESGLPTRTRKAASGEYDRLLGVEEFYYTLSILPQPPDPLLIDQMPVRTMLNRGSELVKRIKKLTDFMGQPNNKRLAYGKLGELLTRYDGVLKQRDAIVAAMAAKAKASQGRRALIAGGIAAALAEDADELRIDGVEIEKWLGDKLKELRADLVSLNNRYSAAPPSEAIEIRGKILDTGLPGDPIVRRMWASRDASGTQ